jgi:hypothetical protein
VNVIGVRNETDPEVFKHVTLSDFDVQLSVAELGAAFRPAITAFPSRRAFLTPDPAKRKDLRARYDQRQTSGAIVGISWASANPDVGQLKALKLAQLVDALASRSQGASPTTLVSLQYGDLSADVAAVKRATGVEVVWDRDVDALGDIDAFAAQVAAMDAVVTISNTTAHVAGALGVPTFLLLPYNRGRHWYWFRSLAHCPWYPSVRYYVQKTDGTWDDALRQCRADIAHMIQSRLG